MRRIWLGSLFTLSLLPANAWGSGSEGAPVATHAARGPVIATPALPEREASKLGRVVVQPARNPRRELPAEVSRWIASSNGAGTASVKRHRRSSDIGR